MTTTPEKTETKKANKKAQLMVFIGASIDGKGKKCFMWADLDKATDLLPANWRASNKYRLYSGKTIQTGASPGAVYEMQVDADNPSSVFINQGRYVGSYEDETQVTQWTIEHHAKLRELELASKTASALRKRLDIETLEPFRKAYQRAGNLQRGLILSSVVKFICAHGGE